MSVKTVSEWVSFCYCFLPAGDYIVTENASERVEGSRQFTKDTWAANVLVFKQNAYIYFIENTEKQSYLQRSYLYI